MRAAFMTAFNRVGLADMTLELWATAQPLQPAWPDRIIVAVLDAYCRTQRRGMAWTLLRTLEAQGHVMSDQAYGCLLEHQLAGASWWRPRQHPARPAVHAPLTPHTTGRRGRDDAPRCRRSQGVGRRARDVRARRRLRAASRVATSRGGDHGRAQQPRVQTATPWAGGYAERDCGMLTHAHPFSPAAARPILPRLFSQALAVYDTLMRAGVPPTPDVLLNVVAAYAGLRRLDDMRAVIDRVCALPEPAYASWPAPPPPPPPPRRGTGQPR